MKIDLDKVVLLVNSHSAFRGMPSPVQKEVERLDGQRLSPREALKNIRQVVRKLFPKGGWSVEIIEGGWIMLRVDERGGWMKGGMTHTWLLVKFE